MSNDLLDVCFYYNFYTSDLVPINNNFELLTLRVGTLV